MENKIYNVEKYEPSSTDSFFFDNNIWMFLFCPLGNYSRKKQNVYSKLLEQIQNRRATIFVSSMLLSEFGNRYLRIDFELWKEKNKFENADYKRDYLISSDYKQTVKSVISSIRDILKLSERMPDNFNSIDIDQLLIHFEDVDFNDSYYIELLKGKSVKFVTEDKDFRKLSPLPLPLMTILNRP